MDPLIGGALISGGSSLLGGLLGKKSKPYKLDGQIWDAARGARLAADDYGFNPLTLLSIAGASGGGSYGGENFMGQAIADAGLAMSNAFTESKQAEIDRLEAENQNLQRQNVGLAVRPKFGGIYSDAGEEAEPDPTKDKFGNNRVAGYSILGADITPYEGMSDAEVIEQRHGDVASWAYGLGTVAADIGKNAYDFGARMYADKQADDARRIEGSKAYQRHVNKARETPEPDFLNDWGQPMWRHPDKSVKTYPPGRVIK